MKTVYYYQIGQYLALSLDATLPFPQVSAIKNPDLFLKTSSVPEKGCITWRVTDARQLVTDERDISWLDPERMPNVPPDFPEELIRLVDDGTLTAVNFCHPRWRDALTFNRENTAYSVYSVPGEYLREAQKITCKKRVHLLAAGDVGGTFLTALKLLGKNDIAKIGVWDINPAAVTRWIEELGQISWPWDYDALPEVQLVAEENIFDCDVLVFAATKAVPAVGSGVQDVRMAQLAANRPLVERYAVKAREKNFSGLFIVMSDPVDSLCQAAYLASNRNAEGVWDGLGLLPEQIQGFGLGVMNARAAWFAKQDSRFHDFLTQGRVYGPHGKGLVVASSLVHYDDALSQELTELTLSANLRIRELGYKPYVAPAVSSGVMQLLLTLRGEWHCSSVMLGDIWFGVRNRFTCWGLEIETARLPGALFRRLRETEKYLQGISF